LPQPCSIEPLTLLERLLLLATEAAKHSQSI